MNETYTVTYSWTCTWTGKRELVEASLTTERDAVRCISDARLYVDRELVSYSPNINLGAYYRV